MLVSVFTQFFLIGQHFTQWLLLLVLLFWFFKSVVFSQFHIGISVNLFECCCGHTYMYNKKIVLFYLTPGFE